MPDVLRIANCSGFYGHGAAGQRTGSRIVEAMQRMRHTLVAAHRAAVLLAVAAAGCSTSRVGDADASRLVDHADAAPADGAVRGRDAQTDANASRDSGPRTASPDASFLDGFPFRSCDPDADNPCDVVPQRGVPATRCVPLRSYYPYHVCLHPQDRCGEDFSSFLGCGVPGTECLLEQDSLSGLCVTAEERKRICDDARWAVFFRCECRVGDAGVEGPVDDAGVGCG